MVIGGLRLEDFWIHPVEFMILSFLTYRAFRRSAQKSLAKNYLTVGFWFCILYGASDEFHQSFVPSRTGSFGDVLLDFLGVVIGTFSYRRLFS